MAYLGAQPAPLAVQVDTNAVESVDIQDGAVTAAKLATGAAASNLGNYVSTVNGSTGAVSVATTAQGALADSAVQPGDLSAVATSGLYSDLTGTPTIPTAVSQLTNDSGYTTNTGTVTSVGGTGSYGGLSLSGTVTSSGNLTFGGTPTGTWPISISGNAATASNGGVTSVNGQTGAVTVSSSPPSTFNAVGTYVMGGIPIYPATTISAGGTYSAGTGNNQLRAASLRKIAYTDIIGVSLSGGVISGTWRYMGASQSGNNDDYIFGTFIRIS